MDKKGKQVKVWEEGEKRGEREERERRGGEGTGQGKKERGAVKR